MNKMFRDTLWDRFLRWLLDDGPVREDWRAAEANAREQRRQEEVKEIKD